MARILAIQIGAGEPEAITLASESGNIFVLLDDEKRSRLQNNGDRNYRHIWIDSTINKKD